MSRRKIIAAISITIGCGVALVLSGCSESLKREAKTITSEYTGGLNRTVTVYDYNGKKIDSWIGKFDVTESDSEVSFDIDGKRVIIQGGIVINEEN